MIIVSHSLLMRNLVWYEIRSQVVLESADVQQCAVVETVHSGKSRCPYCFALVKTIGLAAHVINKCEDFCRHSFAGSDRRSADTRRSIPTRYPGRRYRRKLRTRNIASSVRCPNASACSPRSAWKRTRLLCAFSLFVRCSSLIARQAFFFDLTSRLLSAQCVSSLELATLRV